MSSQNLKKTDDFDGNKFKLMCAKPLEKYFPDVNHWSPNVQVFAGI
jgi:hypothetical protein